MILKLNYCNRILQGSFIVFISVLFLTSCVTKEEFEQLQTENVKLKNQVRLLENDTKLLKAERNNCKEHLNSLDFSLNKVKNEKIELEQELDNYRPKGSILSKEHYTEQEAIDAINDNYEFYERDFKAKNIQVRRKSNASFWVSYEKYRIYRGFADKNREFFVNSETIILEFNENNTYRLNPIR